MPSGSGRLGGKPHPWPPGTFTRQLSGFETLILRPLQQYPQYSDTCITGAFEQHRCLYLLSLILIKSGRSQGIHHHVQPQDSNLGA